MSFSASGAPVARGAPRARATAARSGSSAPGAGPGPASSAPSSASARMIRTSSRDSASPSATPSPHSTTVTASSQRGVEVEVVELVDRRRGGRRRRAPAPGPAPSGGCTRAITKVGEVTSPRTPRPAPIPWVKVVLPAPSSPLSTTRSPGAQLAGERAAQVAHRVGVRGVEDERAQRSAQLDVGRVATDLPEPLALPEADRPGQLLPRDDGEVVEAVGGVDRGVDQRAGHAVALGRGQHAEAAQVHRAADRVEDQRPPTASAVERRRAARRRRPSSWPRCCSSVSASASAGGSSGGRAAKAGADHRQHRGRGLGADAAYVEAAPPPHRRPDPAAAAESSWSRVGVDLVVALHDHHVPGALALERASSRRSGRAACGCDRSR